MTVVKAIRVMNKCCFINGLNGEAGTVVDEEDDEGAEGAICGRASARSILEASGVVFGFSHDRTNGSTRLSLRAGPEDDGSAGASEKGKSAMREALCDSSRGMCCDCTW